MQLYLNDTSPFSRFVLVTAIECGIEELKLSWLDPWATPDILVAANPFCAIPTLQLGDGVSLYESLLICSHLVSLAPSELRTTTDVSPADIAGLSRYAFAKTLMEMAFRVVILERLVGQSTLSERSREGLKRALARIEQDLPHSAASGMAPLPTLCLAVALDYVRFRLDELFEVQTGPHTKAWLQASVGRLSLRQTTPALLKRQPASVAALLHDA